eukprot:CAMPEP_0198253310 /NCGR_PEP_ID=MMETSP1447-20131203/3758_1 /TAXON_ID=420782 /ORGANISM="Chaetoceros dichaeta, Strain CCMP1751" /LENGTH=223 /DNA_ID=CAMNT_0043938935 /DNA_START=47 /DNA_END=715 /DNA_ORIENTATION=-
MKTNMMTQRRYHPNQWLSMLILLASLVHTTQAIPYMSLKSAQPSKCVVAAYPRGSRLTIEYEFLDFKSVEKELTITIKPVHRDGVVAGTGILGGNTSRQKITNASGKIKYDKALNPKSPDHDLEVCVETGGSNRRNMNAIFFSLKFREVIDDVYTKEFGDLFKNDSEAGKDQKLAKEHMSAMEKTIFSMVSETDLLIGVADISKEEEALFSQKSIDMNSAAKW